MEKNKKNYYKKNSYQNNHKKNYVNNEVDDKKNKVTYDSLMHANTISETKEEPTYDKTLVMKYIAISVVLLTIIITSLILFRKI